MRSPFYQKLINEFDPEGAFAQDGGEAIRTLRRNQERTERRHQFISSLRNNYPDSRMEIKRAFSGNMVILHSHWVRILGDLGNAVVDFFRVEGGKVAKHWDIIQPISATAANSNAMF